MSDENAERIDVDYFAKRTLLFLSYFVLAAIPQWMVMSLYMTETHLLYTLTCFLAAFILLILLYLCEPLKHQSILNCVVIICCYELMTLGVGSFVMDTHLGVTMLTVCLSLLICAVVILIGYFIAISFYYPNPYKLGALSLVCFVMVVMIAALSTIHYWTYALDAGVIILIASVILLILSHIFMAHENINFLIKEDTLMLAFIFYISFVIMVVAVYIGIKRVQDHSEYQLFLGRTTPNGN